MSSPDIPVEDILHKAFSSFDGNGDGFLADDEIDKFMAFAGIKIQEEDLTTFKNKIDDPERGELAGKCVYQVSNLEFTITIFFLISIIHVLRFVEQ